MSPQALGEPLGRLGVGSRSDEVIVVVTAANGRYVQPLAVALTSMAVNASAGAALAVFIIDGGISVDDRATVERALERWAVRVEWLAPLVDGHGLPLWGRMDASTYLKLDLGQLLPGDVTKAIWLDADLVVEGDIGALWHAPLGDSWLLAAPDEVVPTVSSRFGVARYAELGLPPDAPYFNAGVMVVNVTAWRGGGVRERTLAYLLRHHRSVYFWDQEALNAACAGHWGELDPRWNVNAGVPRSSRAASSSESPPPYIVHFAGSLKPWTFPAPAGSLRSGYFRYLDMTPWAGWRPPRTYWTALVGLYERSGLRPLLYPLEQCLMGATWYFTRRVSAAASPTVA
jgi:lipopolysaccharide biosynthesis glycosyltransferase